MNFSQVANDLILAKRTPAARNGDSAEQKLSHIELMCKNGLSPEHIFRDLRDLINDCTDEEKNVKLQALKLLTQIHGMLSNDDVQKATPHFTLVIQGDNTRVNNMLCPTFGQ